MQYFGNAAGLNGYTIQSGDKLYLNQYQVTGSKGGMVLGFSDGSNSNWGVKDGEGYFLNDDQTQNASHVRTIDLSSLAGKTINAVALNQEGDTPVGSWAMIYEQISLVSTDGSVHPVYTGQPNSPLTSNLQSGGETGLGSTIDINRGHAIYPTQTTTYYAADHLGSSRLIASGNGYPIWSGVFLPFGQEWNPQITMNSYKFTGDEHDSESNLEHTQFRQYEGTQGRWLSPDPYMGSMDLVNPQSFNRYAYVLNAPTALADPLGLCPPGDIPGHCVEVSHPANWLPSNDGGASAAQCGVNPFCVPGPFNGPGAQSSGSTALSINVPISASGAGSGTGYVWGWACEQSSWSNVFGGGSEAKTCQWGQLGNQMLAAYTKYSLATQATGDTPLDPQGWQVIQGNKNLWNQAAKTGNRLGIATAAIPLLVVGAYEAGCGVIGPSRGFAFGQGRAFAVQCGGTQALRVDLHPMTPGGDPQWHIHLFPLNGEHGLRFPIWPSRKP